VPDLVAFAAMSADAIGLSVGAGEEATLEEFLEREPGSEGMFLSASYDTAAYLEYTGGPRHPSHGENNGDPLPAVYAIGMATRDALGAVADRNLTTMQFGLDGLVIDGRMTFKR
jgi:hypothetical protein